VQFAGRQRIQGAGDPLSSEDVSGERQELEEGAGIARGQGDNEER